jgi:hypothetical protein
MEVRVALDTNRLTDLFQGDKELAERLAICVEVWIPLIVLGEIRAGFYGGTRRLHPLVTKATVRILLPAGRLRSTMRVCSFNSSGSVLPFRTTTCGSRRTRWNMTWC